MSIDSLKARFQAGELGKPEFIAEALEEHRQLFRYVEITRSTDVREIRITPDGVMFQLGDDGVWLYAPADEARVAPIETMNFDRYEPHETRVMDLLVQGAKQVLDIGANIGWYSIRFAKRLPRARIHAFEPIPETYSFLVRNIALNDVRALVTPWKLGLSESSGTVTFFISPRSGTNASLLNVANAADATSVTGKTQTLDEWAVQQSVSPDFIKCDVEGAELLVFRGARETLARCRPLVFAELLRKWAKPFGYHPNDMLAFFGELGYFCFAVGPLGVRRITEVIDETVETNYAFAHQDRHAHVIDELLQLGGWA